MKDREQARQLKNKRCKYCELINCKACDIYNV